MFRPLSLPVAALLVLAIAGQSTASAWSPRVAVGHLAFAAGLATLADGTAIAVYEKCVGGGFCINEVRLKRSTDGGQTWSSPLLVAGNDADMAAVAGRGSNVDVVWRGGGRLRYARSTNSGTSFHASLKLNNHSSTDEPDVARGPAGLVAVSWGEFPDFVDQVSVRVSTDGGSSFGPKSSWRTSNTRESAVAVGKGVVYIAYLNGAEIPVVRTSVDGGATWSAAFKLAGKPSVSAPAVAAARSDAYIAYYGNGAVRYRRTHDKGVSWSAPDAITPAGSDADIPVLSLRDGVLRALFRTLDGLFYTRLTAGQTWTAPERVAKPWVGPAFLGYAGRAIVLYETETDVYAKTRAPD